MKQLTFEDVLPNDVYLERRRKLEAEVIAQKASRRLSLGPLMMFCFENRATLLWQVQEMCRVEGIKERAAVEHELRTYNALLPGSEELSATLLIEIDDPVTRAQLLTRLVGFHERLRVEIEGLPPAYATFDTGQFNTQRVSSVHFVRVPLGAAGKAAFLDLSRKVELVLDHPAYAARVTFGGGIRGALAEDLQAP